jgi:hypothetical protein
MLLDLFCFIYLIALLNVSLLICLNKWGAVQVYQLKRPLWLPESCDFCFFFWLGLLEYTLIFLPANPVLKQVGVNIGLALMSAPVSLYYKPKKRF